MDKTRGMTCRIMNDVTGMECRANGRRGRSGRVGGFVLSPHIIAGKERRRRTRGRIGPIAEGEWSARRGRTTLRRLWGGGGRRRLNRLCLSQHRSGQSDCPVMKERETPRYHAEQETD